MKIAAIASIGNMNRETLARAGFAALDTDAERPGRKIWYVEWAAGSQDAHDIELAKVTIRENSVVIAMCCASSVA